MLQDMPLCVIWLDLGVVITWHDSTWYYMTLHDMMIQGMTYHEAVLMFSDCSCTWTVYRYCIIQSVDWSSYEIKPWWKWNMCVCASARLYCTALMSHFSHTGSTHTCKQSINTPVFTLITSQWISKCFTTSANNNNNNNNTHTVPIMPKFWLVLIA